MQCSRLKNSTIGESQLYEADFRWANLSGATFIKSNLQMANLCNANLEKVQFIDCDLRGAKYNLNTTLPFSREEAMSLGMVGQAL